MKTKNYDLTEKQVELIKEVVIPHEREIDTNVREGVYTQKTKEEMIDHINTCNDILKKLKD